MAPPGEDKSLEGMESQGLTTVNSSRPAKDERGGLSSGRKVKKLRDSSRDREPEETRDGIHKGNTGWGVTSCQKQQ